MGLIKAIGDYLGLVKAGLANKDKIIEAMQVSAAIKNKDYEEVGPDAIAEIMRRKDICAGCKFNSVNAKKDGSYNSAISFEHCILCQCRLGGNDTKEYCLSCTCGAQVWNQNNPNLPPLEVKWKAFQNKKITK